MALLDVSRKGTAWTPLVPTEIVRVLIANGTIVRDGTPGSIGNGRFRLARKVWKFLNVPLGHYPLSLVTAQCYACHRKEIRSNAKSARVLFDKRGR
jgi:hypothetical protein